MTLATILGVVVLVGLYGWYATIVTRRNRVGEALAGVDVVVQPARRRRVARRRHGQDPRDPHPASRSRTWRLTRPSIAVMPRMRSGDTAASSPMVDG